jgi:hypothetical protein
LVEDLIAGVDVKIFATVGPACDKSDKVGIFPDHPALGPVAAIFIDPLTKIEILQVREHKTSVLAKAV